MRLDPERRQAGAARRSRRGEKGPEGRQDRRWSSKIWGEAPSVPGLTGACAGLPLLHRDLGPSLDPLLGSPKAILADQKSVDPCSANDTGAHKQILFQVSGTGMCQANHKSDRAPDESSPSSQAGANSCQCLLTAHSNPDNMWSPRMLTKLALWASPLFECHFHLPVDLRVLGCPFFALDFSLAERGRGLRVLSSQEGCPGLWGAFGGTFSEDVITSLGKM